MNKTYLTIAGVAVVALVGFGILSQQQNDQNENILSDLQNSTEEFTSNVATNVEQGYDATVEGAEELAADANQAYEDAVAEVIEAGNEMEAEIEPAAGDAEADMDAEYEAEVQN